jgi:predicted nucleotidyltransferase
MNDLQIYPGASQHQQLLQAIVAHYTSDPRLLALGLFGSLTRGNWDEYSDLDLDVIIRDKVAIDIIQEVKQLATSFVAIGEKVALIIPESEDAADVVLASLLQFSIRYHHLETTNPKIIDSLKLLIANIDLETIKAAGRANLRATYNTPDYLLDRFVRYAVEADKALQREAIWLGLELLHRMRTILMELFAYSRGSDRAIRAFQLEAEAELQAKLGATLPQYSLVSARNSLVRLLDIIKQDLVWLTNGQVKLNEAHYQLIDVIGRR